MPDLTTPVTNFGPKQFIQVLLNSGYEHKLHEFNKSQYECLGRNKDGDFVFAISFEDLENPDDDVYYITLLFVKLHDNGLFKGEWVSQPIQDELTIGEVNRYFDGVRLQQKYIK